VFISHEMSSAMRSEFRLHFYNHNISKFVMETLLHAVIPFRNDGTSHRKTPQCGYVTEEDSVIAAAVGSYVL